jgi:hypothetical protein
MNPEAKFNPIFNGLPEHLKNLDHDVDDAATVERIRRKFETNIKHLNQLSELLDEFEDFWDIPFF